MTNVTELVKLEELNESDEEEIIDEDNLQSSIFDLSLSLETRARSIELYYQKYNNEIMEIVNKLAGMYIFSNTIILERYIRDICMNSSLSAYMKVILVQALVSPSPMDGTVSKHGYTTLNHICKDLSDVPTPVKVETIKILMKDPENYKMEALLYFDRVVNDQSLECDYRYKAILSLEPVGGENDDDEDDEDNVDVFFVTECMYNFLTCKSNMTRYRVLSGQYILQKNLLPPDTEEERNNNVQTTLISFAKDDQLDYNIRADAADVLMQLGNDINKASAREVIMILGRDVGVVRTIFDNAQNVHIDEFEKSVQEGIEFLNTFPLMLINNIPITFEYVEKKIKDIVKENNELSKNNVEAIEIGLNRIYMDRALYSKYNCTLINIFLKVWTYISQNDENIEEMKKRLIEELIDMSGTCSTGYAERLVNVISGFGDFNFRMTWDDQITANFTGRLNAKARDIQKIWNTPDKLIIIVNDIINSDKEIEKRVIMEYIKVKKLKYSQIVNKKQDPYESMRMKMYANNDYPSAQEKVDVYTSFNSVDNLLINFQENVLSEMMIDPASMSERKNFLTFFRESLLYITEEMFFEFEEHVNETDFNLYIRKAIMQYEGINAI
jgi:hypothetical protein